jgi:hypothetical protein
MAFCNLPDDNVWSAAPLQGRSSKEEIQSAANVSGLDGEKFSGHSMRCARSCPVKSRGRGRPFINPGFQVRRLTVLSSLLFSSADLGGEAFVNQLSG